jgi:hypothetical protein
MKMRVVMQMRPVMMFLPHAKWMRMSVIYPTGVDKEILLYAHVA